MSTRSFVFAVITGAMEWVTLGIDSTGILRVVVHTFEQVDEDLWRIRIISARKANLDETKKYNEMTT